MDTVQEETSLPVTPSDPASTDRGDNASFLFPPAFINVVQNPGETMSNPRNCESDQLNHGYDSIASSRRPSAIIAALRRPSQAIALSAAQAVMTQRRYLLGLFHNQSERSIGTDGGKEDAEQKEKKFKKYNRELGDDALTTILSALYAKLLVVLGMAFPITEIISSNVHQFFYQGFYLYLYFGSVLFVSYMYATLVREKAVYSFMNSYRKNRRNSYYTEKKHNTVRYGSFYLRLGAIAFGIGSMVYSGLEFGRYFELKSNSGCDSNVLQAITPATRMILTLVQIQFIFLNRKVIEMNNHKAIARFGLMHMIATNLCEWLYVLVEETKHEIIHLEKHSNNSSTFNFNAKYCQEGLVMGSLVGNASPFLFPCKIEYSLICAVILFEMWKKVKTLSFKRKKESFGKDASSRRENNKVNQTTFNPFGGHQSNHHFSVDCSNAHRGLFAGIMIIVLTIISLIMFFVLSNEPNTTEEDKLKHRRMAEFEVSLVELILYVITTIAVIVAMIQMRGLKYSRRFGAEGQAGIGLDNTLLVVAQTGMFIYCMFSIIGCYFTLPEQSPTSLLAEIFSFIQTTLQTIFVLDGWWRRCRNFEQAKKKPGRELITFLIIANMAMWAINTLEKNRAEFRPTHLEFFGDWAWTIITHISMPLAIFYRFHSTICLFEIWKTAYKIKSEYKGPFIPLL